MIQHPIPTYPFQRIGSDIFQLDGNNYLVTTDFFSNFFEINDLGKNATGSNVISKLKKIFAKNGIPDAMVADGGPQFNNQEVRRFASDWDFDIHLSSPGRPQSNGLAESSVKIAKTIMKNAKKKRKTFS